MKGAAGNRAAVGHGRVEYRAVSRLDGTVVGDRAVKRTAIDRSGRSNFHGRVIRIRERAVRPQIAAACKRLVDHDLRIAAKRVGAIHHARRVHDDVAVEGAVFHVAAFLDGHAAIERAARNRRLVVSVGIAISPCNGNRHANGAKGNVAHLNDDGIYIRQYAVGNSGASAGLHRQNAIALAPLLAQVVIDAHLHIAGVFARGRVPALAQRIADGAAAGERIEGLAVFPAVARVPAPNVLIHVHVKRTFIMKELCEIICGVISVDGTIVRNGAVEGDRIIIFAVTAILVTTHIAVSRVVQIRNHAAGHGAMVGERFQRAAGD